MKNTNIFNIFFQLYFFSFLDPVFRAIFIKFGQNTGFVKYPQAKKKKLKNKIFHMWACHKIFNHLTKWLHLQEPYFCNLPETDQILTRTGK